MHNPLRAAAVLSATMLAIAAAAWHATRPAPQRPAKPCPAPGEILCAHGLRDGAPAVWRNYYPTPDALPWVIDGDRVIHAGNATGYRQIYAGPMP